MHTLIKAKDLFDMPPASTGLDGIRARLIEVALSKEEKFIYDQIPTDEYMLRKELVKASVLEFGMTHTFKKVKKAIAKFQKLGLLEVTTEDRKGNTFQIVKRTDMDNRYAAIIFLALKWQIAMRKAEDLNEDVTRMVEERNKELQDRHTQAYP